MNRDILSLPVFMIIIVIFIVGLFKIAFWYNEKQLNANCEAIGDMYNLEHNFIRDGYLFPSGDCYLKYQGRWVDDFYVKFDKEH